MSELVRCFGRLMVPVSLLAAGCGYPTAVTVGRSPVAYTPPPAAAGQPAAGRASSVVTPPPTPPAPPPHPPRDRFVSGNEIETMPGEQLFEKPKPLIVPAYTAPGYGPTGPGGDG